MYCKNCGSQNPEGINYCLQDGFPLEVSSGAINKSNTRFCSSCGEENHSLLNYCQACGASLFHAVPDKAEGPRLEIPNQVKSLAKTTGFRLTKDHVKKGLLASVISIVIAAVFSAIVSAVLSDAVMKNLAEIIGSSGRDYLESLNTNGSGLSGMVGVLMNLHAIGVVSHVSGSGIGLSIAFHVGLILLLIFPFIALFLGNWFVAKRNPTHSISDHLLTTFANAVFYAIILGIISLFAGMSIDVLSVKGSSSYSFFGALINGFILAFLFGSMGAFFSIKPLRTTSQLRHGVPFGEAIHQAISTVFRGIGSGFVIAFIFALIAMPELFKKFFLALTAIANFGVYLWDVTNFNKLHIQVSSINDREEMSFSLFGIKGHEDLDHMGVLMIFFYIGLIVAIALIVFATRKIVSRSGGNHWADITVFSAVYAFLTAFVVHLSTLSASVGGNGLAGLMGSIHFKIGFNGFLSFIVCFIFSFVVAAISAILFNKNQVSTTKKDYTM